MENQNMDSLLNEMKTTIESNNTVARDTGSTGSQRISSMPGVSTE